MLGMIFAVVASVIRSPRPSPTKKTPGKTRGKKTKKSPPPQMTGRVAPERIFRPKNPKNPKPFQWESLFGV